MQVRIASPARRRDNRPGIRIVLAIHIEVGHFIVVSKRDSVRARGNVDDRTSEGLGAWRRFRNRDRALLERGDCEIEVVAFAEQLLIVFEDDRRVECARGVGQDDVACLASGPADLIKLVKRMLGSTVAARRRVAGHMDEAQGRAIGLRERSAAELRRATQSHIVVAHERLADAIGHVAGRLEVRPRAANEPLQRESCFGVEDIVVADGELQQEIGVSVSADTDSVAGGTVVAVGNEVRPGKGPGVAFLAKPAGNFKFADGERRIDTSLRQLRQRVSLEADRAGGFEVADLPFLSERYVQVAAQIPELAERLVRHADLREEISRFRVLTVGEEANALDSPFRRIHGEIQPTISGPDVEADAVLIVHRDLPVGDDSRVIERNDLHRADIEVAFLLAVAFGVISQAQDRAQVLREEAYVARCRHRRGAVVSAHWFGRPALPHSVPVPRKARRRSRRQSTPAARRCCRFAHGACG